MAPINCGPCIKCDYFFFGLPAGLRHLPNNKHSFYYAADRDLWQQQTAVNCQLKFMQPAPLHSPFGHHSHPSEPEHFQLGVTTAATLESILIMCTRRPANNDVGGCPKMAQTTWPGHSGVHILVSFLFIFLP